MQAGQIIIQDGKIITESFSEDVRRFYENTLLDRGYRLRIDLIVLYDPQEMILAEKLDFNAQSVTPHLEQYLWRFKNSQNKTKALAGIVKILK